MFPRHLNKHIDYNQLPAPAGTKEHSLATPLGMAVSPDGATLYVAAFGSSRIGVFNTVALEGDTFDPIVDSADYIPVSGGGPSGLVLDAARAAALRADPLRRQRLGRRSRPPSAEIAHLALHNPEPPSVVAGRPFLYDADATSSNGEASCSSCHIFGDMDDLAWDLGNPDDAVKTNPIPINLAIAITSGVVVAAGADQRHRTGRRLPPDEGPDDDADPARHARQRRHALARRPLQPAGHGGLGVRRGELVQQLQRRLPRPGRPRQPADRRREMQAFTDFALQVTLPPNPVRALDNSLTPAQQAGRRLLPRPAAVRRHQRHLPRPAARLHLRGLSPAAARRSGTSAPTGARASRTRSRSSRSRTCATCTRRSACSACSTSPATRPLNQPSQGPQIRGFGFLHDGSVDTLFRFLNATVFANNQIGGPNVGFQSDTERRNVEQFMLAFDTNLAPIVGQQITLTGEQRRRRRAAHRPARSRAPALSECDLIVKGTVAGEARGWLRGAGGQFISDRASEARAQRRRAARPAPATAGQELTYTCVPPGAGTRAGIDRDEDGYFDRDELDAGSDPGRCGQHAADVAAGR